MITKLIFNLNVVFLLLAGLGNLATVLATILMPTHSHSQYDSKILMEYFI